MPVWDYHWVRFPWFAWLAIAAWAQTAPEVKPDPAKDTEDGIAVTSSVVKEACGACHASDEKGRMSRISYRRTTPEGWQQTIKRMVSLNGVQLDPLKAREVVRYLSDQHGLAPEELKPGAFEVEKRLIDYKYTADADTEQTCIKCHSFGRVLLQRRTRREWELLMAMHRGYYPLIDFQAFRRMGPRPGESQPAPPGPPPDLRHPMDKAVAHLSQAFPLKTAAWSAWSANMRAPQLAGRWLLAGYQTGKGQLFGTVEIRAGRQAGEWETAIRWEYARSGEKVERAGRVVLYTGFQWRGRSMVGADDKTSLREVMMVERNQREIAGRWFMGAYEETGIDVKLTRLGRDPVISGVSMTAIAAGAAKAKLRVWGANFSESPRVDLGAGVEVANIRREGDGLTLEVSAGKQAGIGPRDLFVDGAALEKAVVIYDKVDTIKVRPLSGMARLGGNQFPKMMAQFEAVGFANGPDAKPETADDLELGLVDVTWSMEEYTATFADDDRAFVGSLDANGLFTPNVDGPNSARSGNRNNMGDVWIVATSKDNREKPLRGRAHLLVTVPVYMRFDQPEVSQ